MNQSFERGVWFYLKHPGSPSAGERERLPVCGDSGVQTKIKSDGRRKLPREENIKRRCPHSHSYYIFVPDCTGRKQESSLLTFIFQIQTEGERCSGEGRTSRGRKSKLTVGGWVGGAVVSECVCLWGGPRHLSEPTFLCIPGIPQTKRGERARNWPRLCLSTADLSDRDFKDQCTYMPDPRGHKKNTFMTRCMYVHTTQDMWRNGSLAHSVYLFIYWNNHRYYRKRSTFYSF